MAASALRCLVLGREPSGESHVLLTLLEPEEGILRCLARASRRAGSVQPDLFDEAEVTLGRASGGANRFVREYRPLRRQPGIGRSHTALERASRLDIFHSIYLNLQYIDQIVQHQEQFYLLHFQMIQ